MATPKFKKYFNDMFAQNKELFFRFKLLNDDDKASDKGPEKG